jgi:hypothetical protein
MSKQLFFLVLGLLLFQNSMTSTLHRRFSVDSPENQKCPSFKIEFSQKKVRKGDIRAYFVYKETKNFRPMFFNWSISNGEIRKGQYSPSIIIKTDPSKDLDLTATLEVTFYPSNCVSVRSGTILIERPK